MTARRLYLLRCRGRLLARSLQLLLRGRHIALSHPDAGAGCLQVTLGRFHPGLGDIHVLRRHQPFIFGLNGMQSLVGQPLQALIRLPLLQRCLGGAQRCLCHLQLLLPPSDIRLRLRLLIHGLLYGGFSLPDHGL